jgi:hypothetical protein
MFLNKKRNSRLSPGLCHSNLVKLCLNIHWFSWLVKNCTTDPKEKPNIFVKVNASFTKENGTNSNFLWINEVDKDDLNECPRAFNCFEYVSHINGKRTREYFLTGSDHYKLMSIRRNAVPRYRDKKLTLIVPISIEAVNNIQKEISSWLRFVGG